MPRRQGQHQFGNQSKSGPQTKTHAQVRIVSPVKGDPQETVEQLHQSPADQPACQQDQPSNGGQFQFDRHVKNVSENAINYPAATAGSWESRMQESEWLIRTPEHFPVRGDSPRFHSRSNKRWGRSPQATQSGIGLAPTNEGGDVQILMKSRLSAAFCPSRIQWLRLHTRNTASTTRLLEQPLSRA